MSEQFDVKTKSLSVLHSLAEHFTYDARDFTNRFDLLWENLTSRTGRIKSFVDLMMACECALKAHIALGRINDDPTDVYRVIRRAGHRIGKLAGEANFLEDKSVYKQLGLLLDAFSVHIRYSVEAYENFFPWFLEWEDAKINYSLTIGNHSWVMSVRSLIDPLLESLKNELSGEVTNDFALIADHEREMKEFIESFKG